MSETQIYSLRVNGKLRDVTDAWLGESLLYVLRERLGLPGSKGACEQGECGSCTVVMDGAAADLAQGDTFRLSEAATGTSDASRYDESLVCEQVNPDGSTTPVTVTAAARATSGTAVGARLA